MADDLLDAIQGLVDPRCVFCGAPVEPGTRACAYCADACGEDLVDPQGDAECPA